MTKCKNCGKQIPDWFDYCNDNCFNAHQYKIFEKQNKQYKATIAAMRVALEKIQKRKMPYKYCWECNKWVNEALSDTAGAELFEAHQNELKEAYKISEGLSHQVDELNAEIEHKDKTIQALKCCGNCKYASIPLCKKCKDYKSEWKIRDEIRWQLDERLVNKGEDIR